MDLEHGFGDCHAAPPQQTKHPQKARPGGKPSMRAGIENGYEVVHDSIEGMMRLV